MKLFPYLGFPGNCEQALNFYKEVFNGEIVQLSRYVESPMSTAENIKDKVMHARLRFGEVLIMASDMINDPPIRSGDNVSLSVECDNERQLQDVFSKIAAGGKITMPLQEQFWGATFGMLTDKFGIHWMFNCEKKKEEGKQGETLDIV